MKDKEEKKNKKENIKLSTFSMNSTWSRIIAKNANEKPLFPDTFIIDFKVFRMHPNSNEATKNSREDSESFTKNRTTFCSPRCHSKFSYTEFRSRDLEG